MKYRTKQSEASANWHVSVSDAGRTDDSPLIMRSGRGSGSARLVH